MNADQKRIYDNLAAVTGLDTAAGAIDVEQTPTYLREPMKVADFAAGVVAALGASLVEIGAARGLPGQQISVDRRHALLTLNNAAYQYMNGVFVRGGEIQVPVNGIYQAKDGKWLCFNGAYPHLRDGILNYFDAANSVEGMIGGVAQKNSDQIESDFERLGLCCGTLRTHEEWLAHPHGRVLRDTPIVTIEQHGDARGGELAPAEHRPLEGVKVIDATHVVAGPWLTRVLADGGADVISVRNADFPFLYPVVFEESYGKKQIFLDLKRQRDKARMSELLTDADVLVWGYGPGSLDRLGFTQEALMALNPNLVVTYLSAYGPEGPWERRKGWEQIAQTVCGAAELASRGRDQKHLIAALPTDYGAGYVGAIGTIAALRRRHERGGFWTVHSVLCRVAMEWLELPHEAEEAVPVSVDEMDKYLVDQDASWGAVMTKLAPAARLSVTPSYSATGPAILGAHDPWTTGWGQTVGMDGTVTHRPSEMLKRGLDGFVAGYGHEDIMHRPPELIGR